MSGKTDLSQYRNDSYRPGGTLLTRVLWFLVNHLFVNSFLPFSQMKIILLKSFGARIGKGVVLKPNVNIKYPWKLSVGDFSWIGEGVWIDNLDDVSIGKNCCVSQGAMLLCGNHNYKKSNFDLITGKIMLEDGVWIAANALVCPSVICSSHSVLTAGSVATSNLDPHAIYQGNPAVRISERQIS